MVGMFRIRHGWGQRPNASNVPFVVPGSTVWRSWPMISSSDTLVTSNIQGSSADTGYPYRPIAAWMDRLYPIISAGGVRYFGIDAYKQIRASDFVAGSQDGIKHVLVSANNGTWFTITGRSTHPYLGEDGYIFGIRESDVSASSVLEIRAIVVPLSGQPFVLQGREATGPAGATSLASLSDTTAGPRGYAIDARCVGDTLGSGFAEAGGTFRNIVRTKDMWSMVATVDKGDLAKATYYIDTINGSDSNSGADAAHPLKTWDTLRSKGKTALGGKVDGLKAIVTGASTNHILPGLATADSTIDACDTRPLEITRDTAFTKAQCAFGQNAAHVWNVEKLYAHDINNLGCGYTIGQGANVWTDYVSGFFENIDHDGGPSVITNAGLFSFDIVSGGSGFTSAPSTTSFTPRSGQGSGGQITFTVSGGVITGATVTNLGGNNFVIGSGYLEGDLADVSGGGGTGAVIRIHVQYGGMPNGPELCHSPTAGTNCGHIQYVNCTSTRTYVTGAFDCMTLGWKFAVKNFCSASDAFNNAKASFFCSVAGSTDVINHLDANQFNNPRTMHILRGFDGTDTSFVGQRIFGDGGAAMTDLAVVDCKVNNSVADAQSLVGLKFNTTCVNFFLRQPVSCGPINDTGVVPQSLSSAGVQAIVGGSGYVAFEGLPRNGHQVLYPWTTVEPIQASVTNHTFQTAAPGKVLQILDPSVEGGVRLSDGGLGGPPYTLSPVALRDITDWEWKHYGGTTTAHFNAKSGSPAYEATGFNGQPCIKFLGTQSSHSDSLGHGNGATWSTGGTAQFEQWYCIENLQTETPANGTTRFIHDMSFGNSSAGRFQLYWTMVGTTPVIQAQMGYSNDGGSTAAGQVTVGTNQTGVDSTSFGSVAAEKMWIRVECLTDRIRLTIGDAGHPTGWTAETLISSVSASGVKYTIGNARNVLNSKATTTTGASGAYSSMRLRYMVAVQPLTTTERDSFITTMRSACGF